MRVKKSKTKGIALINAYDNRFYLFADQTIKPLQSAIDYSFNFVASYLISYDLISSFVELDNTIPDENVADILEIKAYEELGLDQNREYLVRYIEREGPKDKRVFSIFVVEPEALRERFDGVVDTVKYVDLLVPAPMLYRAIYQKGILECTGVDIFIYFDEKEAFVTFYRSGAYLYSRSIGYSLEQIYEKYCILTGEQVDKDHFFTSLSVEGLGVGHGKIQVDLSTLFEEIYIRINEIIIYVKKYFALSGIDRSYVGSSIGPIPGLDTYSESYLKIRSSELDFDFGIKLYSDSNEQLLAMLAVITIGYMANEQSMVNLSIFEHPPLLYRRTSGQFIIVILLAILAAVSYPGYYFLNAQLNDAVNRVLSSRNETVKAEVMKYEKVLEKKKREAQKLNREVKGLQEAYHKKVLLLSTIYNKKVNYRLVSEYLYLLASDMSHFAVRVDKIQSDKNSYTLSLLSEDEEEMTKLVKYIAKKHFEQIDSIHIETISRKPKDKFFRGVLKVDLR